MNEKILSGRFLLTIIAGMVFAYVSITGKLGMEHVKEIILIVIYGYFTRNDRKSETGGQK